jgi:hypothetical protein
VLRPARLRLIAGLLACVWGLLPLATLIDGLVTEHVYCAEHQALEHAGGGALATAGADDGQASLWATGDAAAEHGDPCPCTSINLREYRAAPQLAVAVPAQSGAVEPAIVATDAAPLPILAFAPKSSPPA